MVIVSCLPTKQRNAGTKLSVYDVPALVARCPVVRSPNRKRLHARSKKLSSNEEDATQRGSSKPVQLQVPQPVVPEVGHVSRASIAISLTPEIEKLRDELAKVAVLSLVEGFVNESIILEVAPSIINRALARPLTPLSDCSYLIPLTSKEEVREVCMLDTFKVATKDDCSLVGRDLGNGSTYGICLYMVGVGVLSLKFSSRWES